MKSARRKTMGTIVPVLLACALVTACMDSGNAGDARIWKGSIQNTCGPADGPAISIKAGRSADTTCTADFSSDTSYTMLLDDYQVESLRVGTVLTDTVFPCASDCFRSSVLTLEIQGVTSGSLSGSLEIKDGGGEVPAKIRKFPILLKKCPRTIGLCG